MAVDSAQKRGSAIDVGLSAWRTLPIPDGTVGDADRQVVPGYYSGISAQAPASNTATRTAGINMGISIGL